MEGIEPGEGGKLLLWHGEPGTGKSYALRTLAWEWRRWCDFHYVIDPEVLLGQSSYLVRVLLNDSSRFSIPRESGPRWRVLILEDCGELLAADAKAATGQALSRLLNLTDGLIGEGFKTLVLISTNDPLKQMHPAVTREGREAARVGFDRHSTEETREWLCTHGVDEQPDGGMTLAGLYAVAAGRKRKEQRRASVGFSARS
ncbi:MAG: AAA family ATPase [Actinomycetota bacterium]|nr:AAA family ATPase [Actinomycetota bacterium]